MNKQITQGKCNVALKTKNKNEEGEISDYQTSTKTYWFNNEDDAKGFISASEKEIGFVSATFTQTTENIERDEKLLLLCSTGYITETDRELLAADEYDNCPAPLISAYRYGFILYVPSDSAELEHVIREMGEAGYSDAFQNLVVYSSENEYELVRLDSEISCNPIPELSLQEK